jgi:phage gp46-like protein
MPDISTLWSPGAAAGGWAVAGADLAAGTDLETPVLISLFTDRRADADDTVPDPSGDRRGWWGDALFARPLGSRLWLLERAKRTEAVRLAAEGYILEALQWLIDDGIAAAVEASAEWRGAQLLAAVSITQPDGTSTTFNYAWAWGAVS